jgi:hypothetical protein
MRTGEEWLRRRMQCASPCLSSGNTLRVPRAKLGCQMSLTSLPIKIACCLALLLITHRPQAWDCRVWNHVDLLPSAHFMIYSTKFELKSLHSWQYRDNINTIYGRIEDRNKKKKKKKSKLSWYIQLRGDPRLAVYMLDAMRPQNIQQDHTLFCSCVICPFAIAYHLAFHLLLGPKSLTSFSLLSSRASSRSLSMPRSLRAV